MMCEIEDALNDIIITLKQMENDIAVIKEDMYEIKLDMVDINYQINQMLERDE